jgi:protein involved in polysaccharide export with SLBB domain
MNRRRRTKGMTMHRARNLPRLLIGALLLPLLLGLVVPPAAWAVDWRDDGDDDEDAAETVTNMPTFEPLAEPIDADRYICGPGDLFGILFWGKKEGAINVAITAEGDLVIPTIGKVGGLVGLTLAQAKNEIRAKIRRAYHNVAFDVFLIHPRSFIVYVAGFAAAPGEHRASATTRVSRLIKAVGGANPYGSRRFVEVWREGKRLALVDFLQIERFGNLETNTYLLDGDLLKIPPRGAMVTIRGAVRAPGRYEMSAEETLADLIDIQGGGFDANLSRRDPVELVSRRESDQYQVHRFTADEALAATTGLYDGDRIYVPTVGRYEKVVRIQGAVYGEGAQTVDAAGALQSGVPGDQAASQGPAGAASQFLEHYGVYPYIEGETVSSAVRRAGGVTPDADTDHAFIRRPTGNEEKTYETIPVNLTRILIERDFSADPELQPGDFLIVPMLDNKVFVGGEVVQPGAVGYVPFYSARHYIGLAGGATSRAAVRRSKLVHRDGTEEDLDLDSVVQPGDTIYVEEKVFKFWQDHWTILTGTAALILSGFAVIYTINQE